MLNQRNNEIVKLTEKEIAILKYLYKAQDRIVAKNELLQEVWGYAPDVTTHTIETHVYRLRQKVEHDDPEAQLIITLEGGYRLKL
ncbi:MAG: winged helix-turn-helix domain-containing protein [Alphaproteobacteria bacterium]